MIHNGSFIVYTLSELAPHWRNSEPDDPRLIDHLRLLTLIAHYERIPDLPVHLRLAYLASVSIKVVDDRRDQEARERARQRDKDAASGWCGDLTTHHKLNARHQFRERKDA